MNNPFFNALGGQPSMPGNMQSLIQRFNQFRQNFRGDPRQQIQQMLNSGQITQEQYNRAVQTATQFRQMLGM